MGDRWLIDGYSDNSTVMLERLGDGKTELVPIHQLKAPTTFEKAPVDEGRMPDSFTKAEWEEARRRHEAIEPLLLNQRNKAELVEKRAEEYGVTGRTLYNWMEKYLRRRRLSDLAPARRGRKMKPRLDKKVEKVIAETINDFYLTPQKPTKKKTADEVRRRCQNLNLKKPHANTVYERIKKISPRKVLRHREGVKAARDMYDPADGHFPDAEFPLAVVQIDHTPLDIIVVDEEDREPLTRPYLSLAIDVFSRMVAGIYLSFDAPSTSSVGLCVSHAILTKDAYLAELGIDGSWPFWGRMRTLHTDNAKEFHSVALQRACEEYGIEQQFRPVRRPEYGGHVERVFRTLNKGLIHTLPGTTFSNVREKGTYDPKKKAEISLRQLERMIVRYIIDEYHAKPHKSLGMTPEEKLHEGRFGRGKRKGTGFPPTEDDEEQLRVNFMPASERTVQRNGITWDYITYYGEKLNPWIRAKDGQATRKFLVRRDPRDISRIYFFDPNGKRYHEVSYRHMGRPSISLWEWREARKLAKAQYNDLDEGRIFGAWDDIHQMRLHESKETKTVRKRRASARRNEENLQSERNRARTKKVAGDEQNLRVIESSEGEHVAEPLPEPNNRLVLTEADLESEDWN